MKDSTRLLITAQLQEFINSASLFPNHAWIGNDEIKIYIRKSYRYLNDARRLMFDIANIHIQKKGKGTFSKWFLPLLMELNPWDGIYVECVQNKRFATWFKKNGWTKIGEEIAPSFYLFKENYRTK